MLGCFYSNLEDLLRKGNHEEDAQIQIQIDDMMETGLLRVFPLAYIRGMSIKNSFIICDEAQNIGRSLIRDIVTRCGPVSYTHLLLKQSRMSAGEISNHFSISGAAVSRHLSVLKLSLIHI